MEDNSKPFVPAAVREETVVLSVGPDPCKVWILLYGNGAWEMQDIEGLLAEGKLIQVRPQGYSMYPLFIPGRDEALIAPAQVNALRRGDVVLYRRKGSILVLHRIWRRKGEQFYLTGDNQREIEGPVGQGQIKGILVGVIRNGRKFSVRHPVYRILSGIWLMLRPLRPALSHGAALGKKLFYLVHKRN